MKALVLQQQAEKIVPEILSLPTDKLPSGEVIVDIHWSTLNYRSCRYFS